MDFQETMHWVYVACMAAGALVFFAMSRDPKGVPQYEYSIAMFIPIWSGACYLAMAVGQGKLEVAGQVTHYARYIDWVVTTPLLLVALALTAMTHIKKDTTLIVSLVAADVFMVTAGLVADLSPYPLRYLWYAMGVAAFAVILYLIWGPLREKAASQGAGVLGVFNRVAGLLTLLWVLYPTIWLLGPSGLGLIGQDADTFWFVLVPVFSKVVWSYVDLTSLRSLYQKEGKVHPHSAPLGASD